MEGYLSVAELSRRFSVSEATIRRDLDILQGENRLTRTYGGALSEYDALFLPFHQRHAQRRKRKQRIARAAIELIEAGFSVFLDAGSTIYSIAELIPEKCPEDLTVVTNSLPVAEVLTSAQACETHLLGGRILPHQLVVVGPGASIGLSSWQFDLAFLSAEGMTAEGLWNSQDDISDFQRHVSGRTARTCFCLDNSKLGRSAPSFLMAWATLDVLVTNATYQELLASDISMDRRKYRQA
jgi:DeoR family glycerol-3-phosphate regulon repressor